MSDSARILTFPRNLFVGRGGFIDEREARNLLRVAARSAKWLPRPLAEDSSSDVQPIPCAVVTDGAERYLLLKRIHDAREDLRSRFSLVVGGHVDFHETVAIGLASGKGSRSIETLLEVTLRRELAEELRIHLDRPPSPVGMVVDWKSVESSRHVGFVFLAETSADSIDVSADEEFHLRRKRQFYSIQDIRSLRSRLDPWSVLLLDAFLDPLRVDAARA